MLGNWVPHELTKKAIANRLTMSELLLQRQKRKHPIITEDEKWIYYDNPKRVKPDEPGSLSPKRDIHCSTVMFCIWCDQKCTV